MQSILYFVYQYISIHNDSEYVKNLVSFAAICIDRLFLTLDSSPEEAIEKQQEPRVLGFCNTFGLAQEGQTEVAARHNTNWPLLGLQELTSAAGQFFFCI